MESQQLDLGLAPEQKELVISTRPHFYLMSLPNEFKISIVLSSALEKLSSNIHKIPADKLDEFLDQYIS